MSKKSKKEPAPIISTGWMLRNEIFDDYNNDAAIVCGRGIEIALRHLGHRGPMPTEIKVEFQRSANGESAFNGWDETVESPVFDGGVMPQLLEALGVDLWSETPVRGHLWVSWR